VKITLKNNQHRIFKYHKLVVLFVFLILTIQCTFAQDILRENPTPEVLKEGWQYRRGDSPFDRRGVPLWLKNEDKSLSWVNIDVDDLLQTPGNYNFIWYKLKLPAEEWINPSLFIPPVILAFEAYLDTIPIYQFGKFENTPENKFSAVTHHFIPLPDSYQGKTLALRIYSNIPDYIGIETGPQQIMIGSEGEIFQSMIRSNIESVIIGFFFMFIGLFSIFIFFKRFKRRPILPLTFGIFSFSIGLFYVTIDRTGGLFIESSTLRYYAAFLSYLMFPVGLYAFFDNLVGENLFVRRIWQAHLLYAITAFILDFSNIVYMPEQRFYYSWFFVATIIINFYVSILEAKKGKKEARVFLFGFSLFGLSGLHDILMGIGLIPVWYWLSQWGALVFVLSLAYLVERSFSDANTKLERYSKELEIKTKKLDKYSQILEEKVAERTQDLNQKNKELENTLKQLQQVQHHLIMHEKMASLGNLVAGVAHEVNNPIGAVKSSADVTARCIEKINEELDKFKSVSDVKKNSKFQNTLKLLKENNSVIVTAGNRVAEIVQSLKNFARLDESEFQTTDIREGIDSTLTLLQHELKNKVEVVKEYGKLSEVECYPNQLNQVFMNLFINAAHAITGNGEMRIKTFQKAGKVIIEISDNGRGIPPDQLKRIFDPGFTTKSRGVGTGLGLAISYNIIEKHNGEIGVESEVGKGTKFIIQLPIHQPKN
jgi:signal transduction histidine kinase